MSQLLYLYYFRFFSNGSWRCRSWEEKIDCWRWRIEHFAQEGSRRRCWRRRCRRRRGSSHQRAARDCCVNETKTSGPLFSSLYLSNPPTYPVLPYFYFGKQVSLFAHCLWLTDQRPSLVDSNMYLIILIWRGSFFFSTNQARAFTHVDLNWKGK